MHLQEVHFSDRNSVIVRLIADTFEQKLKSLAVPPRPRFFPSCKEISVPEQPNKTECILKLHFKVVIYCGNIHESDVEAVSCGQDPKLQSKGRIAQDIIKKCKNLKDELKTLSKKETQPGETILMNCNLKYAKRVIFVITESPSSADQYIFQNCYRNVLNIADQNGITKLALPLIGTGKL
ncbi:hypothetical protein MHBO_003837 [Bonamia ostreae]|uniref:Macro domain-containing protein n=1 Tax=Bonamia ostreae TaxID=126728 RepID=A0ABV2AS06_9EUKA